VSCSISFIPSPWNNKIITEKHPNRFVNRVMEYDGVLVRFMMGQLDGQGMPPGAQKRFDHAMDTLAIKGKAVWSNPAVSRSMGAKDSLVKIKDLKVGLPVRTMCECACVHGLVLVCMCLGKCET